LDATRSALANPGDTKQAFRIADALSFGTPWRMTWRYRRTPVGADRLRRRRRLLDTLTDRAALAALPEGSFGRAYLAFLDSEGITAEGLVAASIEGREARRDPDQEFVQQQLRDQHDLWHTLTGYKGDLLGEAAVLAFSFAQTGHPGVAFLASLGVVLAPEPGVRRFIVDGFRRGRRATWLPAQDWEALLPLPLDQVRRRLGVTPVDDYVPVRHVAS
ncbi:MAG TPA: Coq4 family protein, partial [Kofleriaceae bacterium]|nr:Coq4 family protein [Kofleriaceae bacterium]